MFEVGGLVEVGDLDVGGLRRVRALLLDQLAQLGPPQQLLGGGTAKEFGVFRSFPTGRLHFDTILPECNYDVGDGPTYDERDGAVEGDFRDVRDARRQPNVRQGNLQREVNTVQ